MAQSKVVATPHLKCYINGHLLGTVTSISWRIHSGQRPAEGLDVNIVQEFMPTTYTVSGQVGIVRIHGDGGLEGSGITSFADTILLQKYVKIDLLDRVTEKTIFSSINAVVTDQSWSAEPKGHVTGSFSFQAADYQNEAVR